MYRDLLFMFWGLGQGLGNGILGILLDEEFQTVFKRFLWRLGVWSPSNPAPCPTPFTRLGSCLGTL